MSIAISDNLSRFDQVCYQPFREEDVVPVASLFWLPLQHLAHKVEKLWFVVWRQPLLDCAKAIVRYSNIFDPIA